jgi:hypothetical protein
MVEDDDLSNERCGFTGGFTFGVRGDETTTNIFVVFNRKSFTRSGNTLTKNLLPTLRQHAQQLAT